MSVLDRIMRVESFASEGSKIYATDYDEVGGGPAATASVTVQRLGGEARLIARVAPTRPAMPCVRNWRRTGSTFR
jgi:sulfofructose kinase